MSAGTRSCRTRKASSSSPTLIVRATAIAVFWGWLPALLWVVFGTIIAAGVHDMGSLVVSVRNRAQNIGTLTSSVINARSRTLFLLIIFFLLTLVNAVFGVVMAILFVGG